MFTKKKLEINIVRCLYPQGPQPNSLYFSELHVFLNGIRALICAKVVCQIPVAIYIGYSAVVYLLKDPRVMGPQEGFEVR